MSSGSSQALWRSVHKLEGLDSRSHALAYPLQRLLRLIQSEDILLVADDIRRLCTTQLHESLQLVRITDYHIRYCFIINVSAGLLTAKCRALRVKIYRTSLMRVIQNATLHYTHRIIFYYIILSLLLLYYTYENYAGNKCGAKAEHFTFSAMKINIKFISVLVKFKSLLLDLWHANNT